MSSGQNVEIPPDPSSSNTDRRYVKVRGPLSYWDRSFDLIRCADAFPRDSVFIWHPTLKTRWMLRLPAVDTNQTVHYGTALCACRILSGNKDGYFKRYLDSDAMILAEPRKVELEWDKGLEEGDYVWVVKGEDGQDVLDWAFVPSFDNWIPVKKEALAEEWRKAFPSTDDSDPQRVTQVSMKTSLGASCTISGARDAIEGSHIVPLAKEGWFEKNYIHLRSVDSIDSLLNCWPLAINIHRVYNRNAFALVPKGGKPTVHFLAHAYDVFSLYSNRSISSLKQDFTMLHYIRFALSVFDLMAPFVEGYLGKEEASVLIGVDGVWSGLTAEEYQDTLVKPPAGSGPSVKKRKLDQVSGGGGEEKDDMADRQLSLSSPTPTNASRSSPTHFDSLGPLMKLEILSHVEADEADLIRQEALRFERLKNGILPGTFEEDEEEGFTTEGDTLPLELKGEFWQAGEWYRQAKDARSKTRPREIAEAYYGVDGKRSEESLAI